MGCSHCMDDARADGQHMPFDIFEKAVDFVIRNNIYHGIILFFIRKRKRLRTRPGNYEQIMNK